MNCFCRTIKTASFFALLIILFFTPTVSFTAQDSYNTRSLYDTVMEQGVFSITVQPVAPSTSLPHAGSIPIDMLIRKLSRQDSFVTYSDLNTQIRQQQLNYFKKNRATLLNWPKKALSSLDNYLIEYKGSLDALNKLQILAEIIKCHQKGGTPEQCAQQAGTDALMRLGGGTLITYLGLGSAATFGALVWADYQAVVNTVELYNEATGLIEDKKQAEKQKKDRMALGADVGSMESFLKSLVLEYEKKQNLVGDLLIKSWENAEGEFSRLKSTTDEFTNAWEEIENKDYPEQLQNNCQKGYNFDEKCSSLISLYTVLTGKPLPKEEENLSLITDAFHKAFERKFEVSCIANSDGVKKKIETFMQKKFIPFYNRYELLDISITSARKAHEKYLANQKKYLQKNQSLNLHYEQQLAERFGKGSDKYKQGVTVLGKMKNKIKTYQPRNIKRDMGYILRRLDIIEKDFTLTKEIMTKFFDGIETHIEGINNVETQFVQTAQSKSKELAAKFNICMNEKYTTQAASLADKKRNTKKLDEIQKDLNTASLLSQKAQKHCVQTRQAISNLSADMVKKGKNLQLLEEKIKAIFQKTQKFQKSKTSINYTHKTVEKTAAKVAETTHNIEKISLELCQRTKALNDYTITEADHDTNYAWIRANQTTLKELLDSTKKNTDHIESLFKNIKKPEDYTDLFRVKTKTELDQNIRHTSSSSLENKKTMGKAASSLMAGKNSAKSAKALKYESVKKLKELENNLAQFLNTNSGKKTKNRIDKLNQSAATIDISQCPEKLTQDLVTASKTFKVRQVRIKKLTDLYENIQPVFDENIKTAQTLDQVYEKIAYLSDLAKAYVERATDAATKGAFCTVLAENIMKKIFIPDVRGLNIGKAEPKLTRKGLTVTTSKLGPPPSEAKNGIVESLTPGITKRVKKGTLVTLSHYDQRLDRSSLLAKTDCRQWPGSTPVWDKKTDQPACGCPGDMLWNQDKTACISQIDAALANANCQYPNSYPVWNEFKKRVECGCLPGTAWNRDNSACINSKQAAFERMDCSQYSGTIPGYDNSGNPTCICPDGLPWLKDLNRCANQQDVAIASIDCSQYPGSVPGWDAQNNRAVCNCPSGSQWSQRLGKCISRQELAMANTDCSHLPGSAPAWSYITNKVECECQSPYSQDPMTGKCVDFAAQLLNRQRNFNQEMEQNQREFEQRMAEERRQNQKQLEKIWNTPQPIVVREKPIVVQSKPINNCGRKIPKQELASLKEQYGRMVKQWSHVQSWYENFRLSVGAGGYLKNDRYQKSINIWQKNVSCWNKCAMAAPKSNAKSADLKRFYNCRQSCFRNYTYRNT